MNQPFLHEWARLNRFPSLRTAGRVDRQDDGPKFTVDEFVKGSGRNCASIKRSRPEAFPKGPAGGEAKFLTSQLA